MTFLRFSLACLLMLSIITIVRAQVDLPHHRPAPLYEHLAAVSEQWRSEIEPGDYGDTVRFSSIDERIQTHLFLVEQHLNARPTLRLTERQRARRALLLRELQDYWRASRFPVNSTNVKRTPIFVDERGTHCAVAHLLAKSGKEELVRRISEENNYAYITDLLIYRELPAWAEQHGMTTDELAWIQPPLYTPTAYLTPESFGNNYGIQGGQVREMQAYDDELYLAGTFTHIDSFPAHLIAAWDGEHLRAFPGLAGVIDHLTIDETSGQLYVSGRFYNFVDEPGEVLLARYRAGQWEPLVNSHQVSTNVTHNGTGAAINEIICHEDKLYVAGNFTQFAGIEANHLVVLDLANDTWTNFLWNHFLTGALNDIDIAHEGIAVTGRFALRAGADTVALNYAVFDLGSSAHIPVSYPFTEFWAGNAIKLFYSTTSETYAVRIDWIVNAGGVIAPFFLHPETSWSFDHTTSTYGGMYFDYNLVYGHFNDTGVPGYGINPLGETSSFRWPPVIADGPVTAIAPLGEYFVVAGDFSAFHGAGINDLVIAHLSLTSSTETVAATSAPTVGTDGTTIFLRNLPATPLPATFELFDLQGRPVWSERFTTTASELRLQPCSLPAAVYVYRLVIDERATVGKVVLVR